MRRPKRAIGIWTRRRFAVGIGLAVLGAALLGCAQTPAPHHELATADLTLERARAAGAADHAPNELARAEAKLDAARAALRAKAHERARILAEQAIVDAELAESRAQAAQARVSAGHLRERVALRHDRLAPADSGF